MGLTIDCADEGAASASAARFLLARNFVLRNGVTSGSAVARALRMRFSEAMRHLERMEMEGIISTAGSDGKRAVIVRGMAR